MTVAYDHAGPGELNLLTRLFAAGAQVVPDPSDLYFGYRLWIAGPAPTLAQARERIGRRIAEAVPELGHHLVHEGDAVSWAPDPDFRVDRHVRPLNVPDPTTAGAHQVMDWSPATGQPPWGIWLGAADDQGWWLYGMANHVRSDAQGWWQALLVLLGDVPPPARRPGKALRALPWWRSVARMAPELLNTYRTPPPVPGLAPATGTDRVFATGSVPLVLLKEAARASGSTVNQLILAAVAVAVRADEPAADPLGDPPTLSTVDIREPGEVPWLDNRFVTVRLPLPVSARTNRQRLHALRLTAGRKRMDRLRRGLGDLTDRAPDRVASYVLGRMTDPARVHMTTGNTYMRETMTVFGSPALRVTGIPWMPPSQRCFSWAVSYGDQCELALQCPEGAADPAKLAARWVEAVQDLHAELVA